jgi:hypothetical protein
VVVAVLVEVQAVLLELVAVMEMQTLTAQTQLQIVGAVVEVQV